MIHYVFVIKPHFRNINSNRGEKVFENSFKIAFHNNRHKHIREGKGTYYVLLYGIDATNSLVEDVFCNLDKEYET